MDGRDERLEPVRVFTVSSLRLDPDRWREFVSQQTNRNLVNSFLDSRECGALFLWSPAGSGLSASLSPPEVTGTKVICVSRTGGVQTPVQTTGTGRQVLQFREVQGQDATEFIVAATEEVGCLLPRNAGGVAEQALRFMERQKNETLMVKARMEDRTFLPLPNALHGNHLHDDHISDDDIHGDTELQKLSDVKLLQACESTVIEWAELVSDFLQQDSSQSVLDGLKPLPSEEFRFWKNRLRNLVSIQLQLRSSRAQLVASIIQEADSIYWSTLRDLHRDVQEGLKEAEDVTLHLNPLQVKLEQVEQMEYQQLGANMAAVMEQVCQVWLQSQFYCKPSRMLVLLQEVCNLFIQRSRKFLRGQEVMRSLMSDPLLLSDDVTQVMWTLQTLRDQFTQSQTKLQNHNQNQNWDCPSHLLFLHLDNFLSRLQQIQEVLRITLCLSQLDQAVVSGLCGRKWTDAVQEVYQDFLLHLAVLADCDCDPTEPKDQSFELYLDRFHEQVVDLERRLVSVLSQALDHCCTSSSAAKLVQMFHFVLDRPLIQDQLQPHLNRLLEMVLTELDQIKLLFSGQTEEPGPAAGLCWARQLTQRCEEGLKSYRMIQHQNLDPGESQLVLQRFHQVVDLLQDFRERLESEWSRQLDSDCGFIMEQPLIAHREQGMLGVHCGPQLEALLREVRYMSRETGVKLRPHAAQLFTCRDDITQSYLSLSHMVSCYNQMISDVLQVELPLVQDQLIHLNQDLAELHRCTWGCQGVQQQVEQVRAKVFSCFSAVKEARTNMATITHITQGWAELHLLQRSGDSLLEGGAIEQNYRPITEQGQQLLQLVERNRSLYGADGQSETWLRYLDHVDDKVMEGLFRLMLRTLNFLCDNMKPQGCSVLFVMHLRLQETGSVFEASVGGDLSHLLQSIISDVYSAANQVPRISASRHSNYQVSLQENPELSALVKEVMRRLQQVVEEAELMRKELDRYSHLWQNDRQAVMQEFLTYSRQLGHEEQDAEETPPTLKDFKREMESLHTLSRQVAHLDDVVLHGWLQVDLRPFRDSLLSIILDWTHMYTQHLLDLVSDSLQQVIRYRGDDEESSSSGFPLTETILLLEASGVQLPEHLAGQLQCVTAAARGET